MEVENVKPWHTGHESLDEFLDALSESSDGKHIFSAALSLYYKALFKYGRILKELAELDVDVDHPRYIQCQAKFDEPRADMLRAEGMAMALCHVIDADMTTCVNELNYLAEKKVRDTNLQIEYDMLMNAGNRDEAKKLQLELDELSALLEKVCMVTDPFYNRYKGL